LYVPYGTACGPVERAAGVRALPVTATAGGATAAARPATTMTEQISAEIRRISHPRKRQPRYATEEGKKTLVQISSFCVLAIA
jgi:hypothetical protein